MAEVAGVRHTPSWRVWAISLTVLVLSTAVLRAVRSELQSVHVVLVYLLIVLGGSAYGGRLLGLVLAVLGFLSIDYFFQTPYDLLSVSNSLDWFVLIAFVLTASVAANLLARAQEAALRAERRTDEVGRLSRLGAELLGTGTAEDALSAIAEKVRETLDAETAAVFRATESDSGFELEVVVVRGVRELLDTLRAVGVAASAESGQTSEGSDATVHTLIIPLRVHDRRVGMLGVASRSAFRSDDDTRRFLDALCYYAALAMERVTLVAQAEHAEALRETDRVREALLASVSHDLRTPLSTIKLLAQDSVTRGDIAVATTNASVIEEQADRLTRIVSNLLDMTRLRGNAFPVRADVNAAEDLVGAVARQVTGILGDHRLARQIDQTGPVLLGRFDFVQSQRILTNLIENAVRYSPPGCPVVLGARREDESLVFEVMDDGPGISPNERKRIFEPFYRGPSAVADAGGVGLGLYVARALAEAQGGTLSYVPRQPKGSTFVFRVPAVDVGAAELDGDGSDDA